MNQQTPTSSTEPPSFWLSLAGIIGITTAYELAMDGHSISALIGAFGDSRRGALMEWRYKAGRPAEIDMEGLDISRRGSNPVLTHTLSYRLYHGADVVCSCASIYIYSKCSPASCTG